MADPEHPPRRALDGRFSGSEITGLADRSLRYRDHVPIEVWRAILDGANETLVVAIEGRRKVRMTRLEASLIEIGSGAPRNAGDLIGFIHLARVAAHYVERADAVEQRAALDRTDRLMMIKSFRPGSRIDWRSLMRRWMTRKMTETLTDAAIRQALWQFEPHRYRR